MFENMKQLRGLKPTKPAKRSVQYTVKKVSDILAGDGKIVNLFHSVVSTKRSNMEQEGHYTSDSTQSKAEYLSYRHHLQTISHISYNFQPLI